MVALGAEGGVERANRARIVRCGAFAASATATTLSGLVDDIAEAGIRTVAVRARGFSATSWRAQRSWRDVAERAQSGEWRVQERGRSAVRRRVVSWATPPSAWTRIVYVRA